MEFSIEKSIEDLEARLTQFDDLDPRKRLASCKELVMEEIAKFFIENPWYERANRSVQTRFYKKWLGPLHGKALFFSHCYRLESCKEISSIPEIRRFIEEELKSIHHFFNTYNQFCQYYDSGGTSRDRRLFTDENFDDYPIDPETVGFNPGIHPGCLFLACTIANRQFAKLLKTELESLDSALPVTSITFNGTDTDIVEEMRGKYSSRSILVNDKPATKKQIMQMLEKTYNRKIPNWEQLDQSISRRKKDRFAYHTRIIDALKRHQDRLDERPSRR